MRFERVLHVRRARFENIDQIPVTAFEVVQHIVQLFCSGLSIELKYPTNDMVGANLIGWIEVSGFSCGFERPDDDPRRVRAQIQALAIHESELGQRGSLALFVVGSSD
jgi:hypothetical protein